MFDESVPFVFTYDALRFVIRREIFIFVHESRKVFFPFVSVVCGKLLFGFLVVFTTKTAAMVFAFRHFSNCCFSRKVMIGNVIAVRTVSERAEPFGKGKASTWKRSACHPAASVV